MFNNIIFLKVFSNQVLNRLIFNQVHHIYKHILKVNKTLKWKDLIESPSTLITNGYLVLFKEYYKRNNIKKLSRCQAPLAEIIYSRNVEALKFIIEELDFEYLSILYKFYYKHIVVNAGDLYLAASHISSNLDMLIYLDSLLDSQRSNSNSSVANITSNDMDFYEWDYYGSLTSTSKTGDFEMIKYLVTKAIERCGEWNTLKLESSLKLAISILLVSGRIDIVEWIIRQSPIPINLGRKSSVASSIRSGIPSVLQYCLSNSKDLSKYSTIELNEYRINWNLEIIKWLHDNNIGRFTAAIMDDVSSNSIELVQWLHENRTEGCSTGAMDLAARNGNLEVVKWLHENRTEGCTTNAMDIAAEGGLLEIVKWLHENRTEGCTTEAIDKAAFNGHIEMVKWLHENRTEGCTTNAIDMAAEGGHLELIQWLTKNRTEGCKTDAMDNAALYGHFKVVRWLHSNRTEGCTTNAMDNAANNNYLKIVKWLHANRTEGCTTNAMDWAAENGYMEMVNWLHINRTEGLLMYNINRVAVYGRLEMLKWIYTHREERYYDSNIDQCHHTEICQWLYDEHNDEDCSSNAITHAMAYNNIAKLQWIYNHYPSMWESTLIDYCGMYGCLNILKWMHSKNIKGTTNAMDWASQYNHLATIKWLHHNRTEGCTTAAMDWSIKKDNLDIFKFLYENRTEGFTNDILLKAKSDGYTKIFNWLQENGHPTIN